MKDPLPFFRRLYNRVECDSKTLSAQQAICVLNEAIFALPNGVDPHTGHFLPQPLSRFLDSFYHSWQNKSSFVNDRVAKMLTYLERPIKAILDSPRDKIIRTHCMQKQQQAKSVDSISLKWLTHQPGASTYEKCALARNILAVKREFNLDTSENRLLKTFFKHLLPLLQVRQETLVKDITPEETSVFRLIKNWLHEQGNTIRDWNNLPPNNVLLQDKNYRKIWNAWSELQILQDTLESDSKGSSILSLQVFFFILLARLMQKGVKFAEIPINVNLRSGLFSSSGFEINIPTETIWGISGDNIKNVAISLSLNNRQLRVCTSKKQIIITSNQNETLFVDKTPYQCTGLDFSHVLTQLLKQLAQNGFFIAGSIENTTSCIDTTPCIDFYHNFPIWSGNDCILQPEYTVFLARQYWHETKLSLPLAYAQAWQYDNDICNTNLLTDLWNHKFPCYDPSRFAIDIAADIRKYFNNAERPTFILPDMLSDLDERAKFFKIALTQAFSGKDCSWLPVSIATVFSLIQLGKLVPKEGMTICVAEQYGDILSLTPVTAKKTSLFNKLQKDIPETGGFVWERYPSQKFNVQSMVTDNLAMTILAEKYTSKQFYEKKDKWHFPTKTSQRICVKEEWIRKTCRAFTKEVLIVVSPGIEATRRYASMVSSDEQTRYIASGAAYLNVLEGRGQGKYHLWSDVLPSLAIMTATEGKRQYTSLISDNHEPIYAEKGRKKALSTGEPLYFIIQKEKQKQECRLIMENGEERLEYRVELQLPSIPLDDIKCELVLNYTYGDVDPYTLDFKPSNAKTAGFPLLTGYLTRVDNTQIDEEKAYAAPMLPPLQTWPQLLSKDDEKLLKRLTRFDVSWWNTLEYMADDVDAIINKQQAVKICYCQAEVIDVNKLRNIDDNEYYGVDAEIPLPSNLLEKNKISPNTRVVRVFLQPPSVGKRYPRIKHISYNSTPGTRDFTPFTNTKTFTPFVFALNSDNETIMCHCSAFINKGDYDNRFSSTTWYAITEKQTRKRTYDNVDELKAIIVQQEPLTETIINQFLKDKKRDIRIALKRLIHDGRRPFSEQIPLETQQFLHTIVPVLWQKLKLTTSPALQEIIMEFFASLGTFQPTDFGPWLLERYKSGKECPGYVLGTSIGDLEQSWQVELCQLILKSWENKNVTLAIKMATGIAADRSDKVLKLMNELCAKTILNYISEDLAAQALTFENKVPTTYDIQTCSNTLQFLISMLRLRTMEKQEIRDLLYPTSPVNIQLQQSLLKLMSMKLDITRRIHGEVKPLPDELYHYLTGDNTSDYIEIIEERADIPD